METRLRLSENLEAGRIVAMTDTKKLVIIQRMKLVIFRLRLVHLAKYFKITLIGGASGDV